MLSKNQKQGDKVLSLLQEQFPGYHPMIGIAKIAHSTDDERLKYDCHKTLSEYVEPKLKSVEVEQTLTEDSHLKVIFEGDYEDITKKDGTSASAPALEKLPVDDLMDQTLIVDEAVNS